MSTGEFSVFLSFRGQETRRTFVSHLRCSLDRRGITSHEDENELREGESVRFAVDGTIGESKVAVVLISEQYASSPRSLESLVKILGFHHSGSLALISVFYEIDPSDVRTQSGKLSESFSLLEIEYSAKVQSWRKALSQLADISGGQYTENWKGDAELISKITDDIWGMLIGSKSIDLSGLVGMDRNMKTVYGLLDLGRRDEVRWINIFGRPGIGKTEFAKYMYDEILHYFDIHLWLDESHRHSFRELDFKLSRYKARNQRPRVLLVAENAEEARMLDFDSFGPGSRVIVITRQNYDHKIITPADLLCYELKGLEFPEALQLCLHAFEQTHPSVGFEEFSCRAVNLAGGSPSTIKSLGLRLSGQDREEWEAILSRSGKYEHPGISLDSSATDTNSTQSSRTHYSEDLVGMNRRMQAVSELLELGSQKEVRVVGIWGTGGIGKTTLARYAYEGVSQQFHSHVFLGNAEENSSSSLEERFLSKALERQAFATRNSKDGSDVVKSWFRHQKFLLVVDGVDCSKALEDIRKITTWLGPGSRVIVITQDESFLLANGVKHVYEVKCLRFDEAFQLFYQFAMKQKPPSDRFKQLSVRAIKLVGFLPLALKVTASMLYDKEADDWETILQSLEEKQDNKGSKLEVSAK